MTTYLKSYGMSERYVIEKDKNNKYKPKQSFNKMEWNGNYDGNKAHIDIHVNKNGDKEHMDIVLTNNDLMQILNVPEVNIPIHQRLQNDFLLNTKTKTKTKSYKRRHHKKSTKKNRSHKSRKSRKMQKLLSLNTL